MPARLRVRCCWLVCCFVQVIADCGFFLSLLSPLSPLSLSPSLPFAAEKAKKCLSVTRITSGQTSLLLVNLLDSHGNNNSNSKYKSGDIINNSTLYYTTTYSSSSSISRVSVWPYTPLDRGENSQKSPPLPLGHTCAARTKEKKKKH